MQRILRYHMFSIARVLQARDFRRNRNHQNCIAQSVTGFKGKVPNAGVPVLPDACFIVSALGTFLTYFNDLR